MLVKILKTVASNDTAQLQKTTHEVRFKILLIYFHLSTEGLQSLLVVLSASLADAKRAEFSSPD